MGLIFVTGISGAGKSAVRKELLARGYKAYDTDEDNMSYWVNNKTGARLERFQAPAQKGKDWYSQYAWKLYRPAVERIASEAQEKLVFLCGTVANDIEVWDLFSKVVYLDIDEATLRHRIATRTDNDYGQAPHELQDILGWHKESRQNYPKFGAIVIDATQPLGKVVDRIIESMD